MSASWSTVVLTLGGIVATGVATATVAWLARRSERRQAWRQRQTEAASAFAAQFAAAEDAVRYALAHREDAGARDQPAHLAGEVTRSLGPVALLFGDRAAATVAARAALDDLKLAAACARAQDWDASSSHLEAAVEQRQRFMDGVLVEVAEGWRPPA